MFKGCLTHTILRALDWLTPQSSTRGGSPEHLQTGRRGEEDAYFYLRRRGYTMVARNYRSPHHRGELDLVGWDRDVLCFIEVKTRTTRAVKPAEAAVDRDKQQELRLMARDFLRHMGRPNKPKPGSLGTAEPSSCQWRFDVVSVYYDQGFSQPSFELFQNAFPVAYNREFARSY